MNYRKLAEKYLNQKSNNNAHVAVALVAGLAAGAVISILFAPDRGDGTRKRIANRAKGLGSGIKDTCNSLFGRFFNECSSTSETTITEKSYIKHSIPKKRKSSIKEIIEEKQHTAEHNSEEQL